MSEKCCILIQISLQVVPNDYINKKLALDQVMAKQLSSWLWLLDIYITDQWVKDLQNYSVFTILCQI